jgi:hypothetical protein
MASAADRFNINSQLEHLQSRYVGTGHADTNRFEWAVNIHRDSYAAYVGRPTMLQVLRGGGKRKHRARPV